MIDLSKNFQGSEASSEPKSSGATSNPPEKFQPTESAPMVEDIFSETAADQDSQPSYQDYTTGSAGRVASESSPKTLGADDVFEDEGLSGKQKIILIAVAVLVVAGLAVGGYFLYNYMNDDLGTTVITNFNQNKNTNSILNHNDNQNENLNQVVTDLNLANTNVEDLNTNVTQNDSDGDGLTDADELLYGSDMTNNDSDGDGYLDGEEVKNGYDPMGPGKLIE